MTDKKYFLIKKTVGFMVFSAAVCMVMTIAARGETTLESVHVSARYSDWEGGMARIPEFTAPRGCGIEVEWTSSESSFKPGNTVGATITLIAEDDVRFGSKPKLSVDYGTITGKTVSDHEIVMKVRVGPLYYKLAAPEHVSWTAENSSVLKWSKVRHATAYRVRIYQDDRIIRREDVRGGTYDAGKYFNGDPGMFISVAAIDESSSDRNYIQESEERFLDSDDVDWEDRETTYGIWQGNRYRISDLDQEAEYAKGWIQIFGRWYYFNQNGTLQTGWIQDGDTRYYSDQEGAMQVGWVQPRGSSAWYYFSSSGAMQTGWIMGAPGTWYYLNEDGAMHIGWLQSDGKRYFMGLNGKMLYGWNQINGQWYYFHDDGHMAVNEQIDQYRVNGDGIWIQ